MDFETVSADEFGRSLKGLGLNLLVRDVVRTAAFLADVFEMKIHRQSEDFAIVTYGEDIFQLHSDGTYHSHPLPSLIPENGPRGGGIEIRLYETNPDEAVKRAQAHEQEAIILQKPTDKSGTHQGNRMNKLTGDK